MPEASIVVKLKDMFSAGTNSMTSANKGFNVSLEETQRKAQQYARRFDDLISKQSKLQTSLVSAKKELNSAATAFKATGDAADSEKLTDANEKYNRLKAELQATTRAAKDTQKAMYDLGETGRKQPGGNSSGGIVSKLGSAGATAMIGNVISQAVGTYATSALGDAGGNMISSALSSASVGAAIGSAIAPGIGTAIGAALGGAVGTITAKMDEVSAKDDAYREVVQSTYSELLSQREQSLENGSSIAGGRETTRISFSTLLGSEAAADGLLGGVRDFSNLTPYMYDDMTKIARQLLAYGYDESEIMPMLTNTGNASSALGAGASGMATISEVLGRMNMGTIENEQLKRLIDLGINPYEMLAKSSNELASNGSAMISSGKYGESEIANIQAMMEYVKKEGPYTAEVIKKMVSDGLIPAKMAAQALADAMGTTYAGSLEAQSRTYEGLTSTLAGLNDEMDAAMGKSYNDARMDGMREQIAWLQGDGSTEMQKAYALMGEFQASLENKKEELQRDAINSVMTGVLSGDWSDAALAQIAELMKDYDTASVEGDGAEMGRVIAAAQSLAQAEYTNSEGYQTQLAANLKLIDDVQTATAHSYYTTGYELAQELSKGVQDGLALETSNVRAMLVLSDNASRRSGSQDGSQGGGFGGGFGSSATSAKSHAYGLERVPYDNYLALLHQGERVQTAAEARRGTSAGVQIAKLADQIVVREDADIDRIAGAIADRVQQAMLTGVS